MSQFVLVVKWINAGECFGVLNLFMPTEALFTLSGQTFLLFMTRAPQVG